MGGEGVGRRRRVGWEGDGEEVDRRERDWTSEE